MSVTVRFRETVSIREAEQALTAMESEGRGTYQCIRMTSSGLLAVVDCDDPSAIPGVAEVGVDDLVCAECGNAISLYDFPYTLSDGRSICSKCLWEAAERMKREGLNEFIRMSGMFGAVPRARTREAVSRIAAELDSHVADCPFCGGRPHARLIDGLASVECGCGAVYMCKDCTGSVTETLERYSRRIK